MSTARRMCPAMALALLTCAPKQPPAVTPTTTTTAPTTAATPAPVIAAKPPQPEDRPLPWPEDCPPLAGARVVEIARISANVGDSPKGATYIVASGELTATFAAWRDAATARGSRVLAEHASERVRTASLIDRAGGRAHILLQRSSGSEELAGSYHRGRQAPVELRGPCASAPLRTRVFDVERSGFGHHGEYLRERGLVHVEPRLGHDLDADGELDLLVPTDGRAECPRDLTWTVYLSRDGCAHAVGEVGPGDLRYEDIVDPPAGPRPLVFESQANALGDGGVVATKITTTYTFKAGRYVRTSREEDRGVCYHCPIELCQPPGPAPGGSPR